MDFVYIQTVAVFARYKHCVYIYLLFRTLFTTLYTKQPIDMVWFCPVWLRFTLSIFYIQPLEGGQDYIIYGEQGMHGTG